MLNLKDFLYFYRILNWKTKLSALRPLGHLFFGYLIASQFEATALFFNSLAVLGLATSSYALNDFLDWKNQKETNFLSALIESGKVSEKKALVLCLLPLLLIFGLVFVHSAIALFLFLIVFFLVFSYSVNPFRLKQRKVFGLITSPIAMVVLFLQGYFVLGLPNLNIAFLAIILLIFQFQLELLHVLEDSEIKEEVTKLSNKTALIWLKTLPLISLLVALFFSFLNPLFFVSVFFSLIRYFSYRNFKISEIKKTRRNFFSAKLSVYEFGIYGILALFGVFAN